MKLDLQLFVRRKCTEEERDDFGALVGGGLPDSSGMVLIPTFLCILIQTSDAASPFSVLRSGWRASR